MCNHRPKKVASVPKVGWAPKLVRYERSAWDRIGSTWWLRSIARRFHVSPSNGDQRDGSVAWREWYRMMVCEDCLQRSASVECSCGSVLCSGCGELHIELGHQGTMLFEVAF